MELVGLPERVELGSSKGNATRLEQYVESESDVMVNGFNAHEQAKVNRGCLGIVRSQGRHVHSEPSLAFERGWVQVIWSGPRART